MQLVGTASGVHINAPDDSYISYFNSPYVGHRRCSAVDIYPSHGEWNGPAIAPCDGKISENRRLRMGGKKPFRTEEADYAIGIQPEGSKDLVVRVLHCESSHKVGESISLGDEMGRLIRSRYFNFWTGPHYHVEIMQNAHFHRSTKSKILEIPWNEPQSLSQNDVGEINLEVEDVSEDILIGRPTNLSVVRSGNWSGVLAHLQDGFNFGILDGGLPHYSIGGVVFSHAAKRANTVGFLGHIIGNEVTYSGATATFQMNHELSVLLDGKETRGLSLFLYSPHHCSGGIPPIRIIPSSEGDFLGRYRDGDTCVLTIDGKE